MVVDGENKPYICPRGYERLRIITAFSQLRWKARLHVPSAIFALSVRPCIIQGSLERNDHGSFVSEANPTIFHGCGSGQFISTRGVTFVIMVILCRQRGRV